MARKTTTSKKSASKKSASKKRPASKSKKKTQVRAGSKAKSTGGKKPAPRKKKVLQTGAAPLQARAAAAPPSGPSAVIPIPPTNTFNQNLHSATEATMLQLFGVPGQKTDTCSDPTGAFKQRIVWGTNAGPFKVSGLDIAVNSLKAVFADATAQMPDVMAALKTAGMLCVRHKAGNRNSFSNHSWGTAIDLFFGKDVVPFGTPKTYVGCLQLAPFFNKHGWYWGAGFSGSSVDSMHYELAEETIRAAQPHPLASS